MRILHVSATLDPLAGGTTAAVIGMACAQAQAGLGIHIVSSYSEKNTGQIDPQLNEAGVDVHLVGPTKGPLRRHPDLEPTLRRHIADSNVVHVQGLWEEPQHLAIKIAKQLNKPLVLSPHGMLDRWSLQQSKLKKQLYMAWRLRRNLKRIDAFHFTTEEELQSVSRFNFPGRPLVLPLGIDLREFDPLPEAGNFRKRFPGLGEAPYLLFLSRLHHKKGLELLLPAFAEILQDHPEWKLVIAGPPESDNYLTSLKTLAADLKLLEHHHVFFVGMQHGIQRIEAMVDAECFVLPSYQENFGIVVAEAGAAGLPQIISEHVNLASFVRQHNIGWITEQNIDSVVRQVTSAIDCKDRSGIGDLARKTFLRTYESKQIGRQWIGRYRSMCHA